MTITITLYCLDCQSSKVKKAAGIYRRPCPDVQAMHQYSVLLGVTRLTFSKIANCKGSVTSNIALRIEKVFGGNADFWLRMQRGFDLLGEKKKFNINPPQIKKFAVVL